MTTPASKTAREMGWEIVRGYILASDEAAELVEELESALAAAHAAGMEAAAVICDERSRRLCRASADMYAEDAASGPHKGMAQDAEAAVSAAAEAGAIASAIRAAKGPGAKP